MKVASDSFTVRTGSRIDLKNITREVNNILRKKGITTGICLVSVPHTTCGLVINEDEAGLIEDTSRLTSELLEPLYQKAPFLHDRIDDNARAHLMSSLLGRGITIPVREGRLYLGTWQSIFLVECDGPRTRSLALTLMGE